VAHAHAEFRERPEQGHFLGDNLSSAQKRQAGFAVACLDSLEVVHEGPQRALPRNRLETTRGSIS